MPQVDYIQRMGSKPHQLAVLLDPDKVSKTALPGLLQNLKAIGTDYIFVGSSLLGNGSVDVLVPIIKRESDVPVILFPGHPAQVSSAVDAILLLSLISGRNADLLIGQHVHAAVKLKSIGKEIIPTGYMLVDGGAPTSASYMSNTVPIPANKADIAVSTAIAGELLGLKLLYLDAGSGAGSPIPTEMISSVRANTSIPLLIGGGIRKPEQAEAAWKAGANVVVVGTAVEENTSFLDELALARIGLERY